MIRRLASCFTLFCAMFAMCAMCAPTAYAADPEIVFIAATNHAMPLSRFENGVLSGGIVMDLGEAIAQRMGRRARFVSAPPKRVEMMLTGGEADSVCYVVPRWLNGRFNWSKPLIPATGVLVARSDAPVVRDLGELAGKPVGTVAGYRYTNFEKILGKDFVREDAPSMQSNMSKLEIGRMQYAVMERTTYDYLARVSGKTNVRVDLEFEHFRAQCAFSEKSAIPFADAERAINSLLTDGSVEKLLARYR